MSAVLTQRLRSLALKIDEELDGHDSALAGKEPSLPAFGRSIARAENGPAAWSVLKLDGINALHYDVDPTGATRSDEGLIAASEAAMSAGKKLIVPAGDYLISDQLEIFLTADLVWELDKRAFLRGSSAMASRMIGIYSPTSTYDHNFVLKGGYFDASEMPNSPAGQAWDVIGIYGAKHADLSEFYIYHGDDYRTAGADSGIFFVGPGANIRDFTIEGAWDAGIYLSGDDTGAVGQDCFIDNGSFITCSVGLISKRTFKRYHATKTFLKDCGVGISQGEASGLQPGYENVIDGVIAQGCIHPLQLRLSDYSQLRNFHIDEYGFDLDGVANTTARGVAIQGSKYCRVSHGFIRQTTTDAGHRHISLQPRVSAADGLTYDATDNVVHAIDMVGGQDGVVEDNSSQTRNRIFDIFDNGLAGTAVIRAGTELQSFVIEDGTFANGFQAWGAATGARPALKARGSDTDVSIDIQPKGAGTGYLRSGAGAQVMLWDADKIHCVKPLLTPSYTVANLPPAGSSHNMHVIVTDSSIPAAGNFGAVVVGGGAIRVPAYCDGGNWRIG